MINMGWDNQIICDDQLWDLRWFSTLLFTRHKYDCRVELGMKESKPDWVWMRPLFFFLLYYMPDKLTACSSCLPNLLVMAQYQTLAHINFFMVNFLRFITRKQLELSLCLMSPEPPHLKQYKNGRMIWTIK